MNKNRSIWESFNNAVSGIVLSLRYERNIRIHFFIGVAVLAYTLFIKISMVERALVVFAVFFVITAEMFNTAVEHITDYFLSRTHNPMIRMIKDISSGAVLMSVVNAVFTGYFILYKSSYGNIERVIGFIRQMPGMAAFVTVAAVTVSVIAVKALTGTGTPFHGGFPSGHAAFSFSIVALSVMYVESQMLVLLIFIMAMVVCKSRLDRKIHTLWQLVSGGLLGFFLTVLINILIGG